MDELALRTLLNKLDAAQASLHGLLHVFNWFVIVGLGFDLFVIIKEFWDDWKEFKYGQVHPYEIHLPKRPSVVLLILGLIGTALIVIGVAGEWNVDVQAGKIETQITAANLQLLGLIIQEAGDAKTSAKGAADGATRANTEAGKAQQKADAVGKRADDLLAKYIAAERQVAELQERVALRRLLPEQRKKLIDFLTFAEIKKLPKGTISVARLKFDDSAQPFAEEVRDTFAAGGWPSGPIDKLTSEEPTGIGLIVLAHSQYALPRHFAVVQQALEAAGLNPKLGENSNVPEGTVQIFVGIKP